ncbi:MAG TPA: hypothetical protein VM818_16165 [Vicinamibacterales bacterium]|nr:hypothetical protein [Vicinamibacterales bacterium]
MTGSAARHYVEVAAQREAFIAADVIARALTVSTRTLLRDWRRQQLPETKVGRCILFPARTAYAKYFREGSIAMTEVLEPSSLVRRVREHEELLRRARERAEQETARAEAATESAKRAWTIAIGVHASRSSKHHATGRSTNSRKE